MDFTKFILPLIIIIVGFVICFNGYRMLRASITCLGAFVGFEFGKFITEGLFKYLAIEINPVVSVIVIAVFTIGLGVLAFTFHKRAVIYITTFAVTMFFGRLRGGADSFKLMLIGLAVGIVLGFLFYMIQKWAIMFVTSYGGAYMISTTFMVLLTALKPVSDFFTQAGTIVVGDINLSLFMFVQGVLVVFFLVAGFIAQLQGEN